MGGAVSAAPLTGRVGVAVRGVDIVFKGMTIWGGANVGLESISCCNVVVDSTELKEASQ